MEVAIVVPLIIFASIVLLVATPFFFRYRNRKVIYDAIKISVEKTGSADPKLIDAITHDNIGPNGDLRRGILLLGLAAAFILADLISPPTDTGLSLTAIGFFPGVIGAAYMIFHFFVPKEPTI